MFDIVRVINGGVRMLGKLKNVEYHRSSLAEIYIADLDLGDMTLNITYNCTSGELFMHEWYLLSDIEYVEIRDSLLEYFEHLYASKHAS